MEMLKQTATFTIRGRLSGLNEYTKACRSNRYEGARMKKNNEGLVMCSILYKLQGIKFNERVRLTFKWYEETRRRDLDNIAFGKKFIQDALVACGVLKGDGWQHIAGFTDEFYIDKENPRIEVIISEV